MLLMLALVASPARAVDMSVSTSAELTSKLALAGDGDRILLATGTYDVSPITLNESVSLIGAGSASTTIQTSAGTVVTVDTPYALTLEGLTLEPGADSAVVVEPDGEVTLRDVLVQGTSPDEGAIHAEESTLTLDTCQLLDNHAELGAHLYARDCHVTLTGGAYRQGSAFLGGAVYLDGGSLTATGASFTENGATNQAYGSGGALWAEDATVSLTGTSFSRNTAENAGGHVFLDGGTLFVTGATFANGSAADAGGLALNGGADVTIADSTFTSNGATSGSGAHIYQHGGDLSLERVSITAGFASSSGGQLYLDAVEATLTDTALSGGESNADGGCLAAVDSSLSLTDSSLTSCAAAEDGGGLHLHDSTLELVRGTLTGNSADQGGALVAVHTPITSTGSTWEGNHALEAEGGAVWSNDALTLAGDSLAENTAATRGGAIYATGGLDLSDSTLTENNATESGGGVAMLGGVSAITRTELARNTSDSSGGGLWGLALDALTLTDVGFTANTADVTGGGMAVSRVDVLRGTRVTACANSSMYGGGLWIEHDTVAVLDNLVAARNSATGSGGGLAVEEAELTLRNASVLANTGTGLYLNKTAADVDSSLFAWTRSGNALVADAAPDTLSHCAWYENTAMDTIYTLDETHLVDVDPQLTAFDTSADDCDGDDLRLLLTSLLLDAGDPERTDPDGSPTDVGALGGEHADPDAWTDGDSDGSPVMWDCDDDNALVNPGEDEVAYDGLDNDCVDGDLTDVDGDTWDGEPAGGEDCNDQDATVYPGATDPEGDGIDQDCDGYDGVHDPDTGDPSDLPDRPDDPDDPVRPPMGVGCTCATPGQAPAPWALLPLLWALGRARSDRRPRRARSAGTDRPATRP